jgi:predicted nucleotidyltransferase
MTGVQDINGKHADALELPQNVSRVLNEFVRAAKIAFGPDLESITLYGSAAEGKMRAASDVNVIVLLKNFSGYRADQMREPLRKAQAAIQLKAMILLSSEVDTAASAFSQRFADVIRRHVILHGSDPFAALEIPRESKLFRLKQVLLDSVLKLREAYVQRSQREEQLAIVIADAAGPLRSAASTLLELEAPGPADVLFASGGPNKATSKSALERVAREVGEDANFFSAPLQGLSTAREERLLPPGVAGPTLLGLIELASRMRVRAEQLD